MEAIYDLYPNVYFNGSFNSKLLIIEKGKLTTINIENLVVTLPTLVIAFLTKSLMWTVVFGIVAMTLVRYLGIF